MELLARAHRDGKLVMQQLSSVLYVARKEHRCSLCGRMIRVGEQYGRQTNIGDDGLHVWKECGHCRVLANLLDLIDCCDEDGYTSETVLEFDPETVAEARLLALFRKKWTRRDGTLYPHPERIVMGT